MTALSGPVARAFSRAESAAASADMPRYWRLLLGRRFTGTDRGTTYNGAAMPATLVEAPQIAGASRGGNNVR